MKVAFCFRYFWPQTPHLGDMELDIVNHLERHGHEVSVFAGATTHHGGTHGTQPARVPTTAAVARAWTPRERRQNVGARLINEALFQAQFAWWLLRRRRELDVVVVQSTPPFVAPFIARILQHIGGPPFVLHMLDIHPEVDLYARRLGATRLYRLLRWLDGGNTRAATYNVVLSSDMAHEILRRRGAAPVSVIPNFVAGIETPAMERDPEAASGVALRVVFAGNMGRYQGLEAVIDALCSTTDVPIEATFVGSGAAQAALEHRAANAGGDRITFLAHRPLSELSPLLERAHVGIVSLLPGVSRAADPSKIPILLAHRCRLLTVVDDDCDLAHFVEAYGIGSTTRPEDPVSIADALRKEYLRIGVDTDFDAALEARHSRSAALESWRALIESIERT